MPDDPPHRMALEYERQLADYWWKPDLQFLSGPINTPRMLTSWARAARAADELGVDYVDYVRAIFWWKDLHWRARPRLSDLAARRAPERVRDYFERVEAGEIDPDKPVRAIAVPVPRMTRRERYDCSERLMNQLVRTWGTEEIVLLQFAATQRVAGQFFDLEWLVQVPTWQRLYLERRVR
jgi:hypothetical protein